MELLKTLCNILFSIVHVLQEIYNNRAEKRLMSAIEIFLDILQRFKHLNNKLTLTKAYSRSKHVCGYVLWLGAYFSVQYYSFRAILNVKVCSIEIWPKRVVAPAPLYNNRDKGQVNVKKFCDAIYILIGLKFSCFVCSLLMPTAYDTTDHGINITPPSSLQGRFSNSSSNSRRKVRGGGLRAWVRF